MPEEIQEKVVLEESLNRQFDWFKDNFAQSAQKAVQEFFGEKFLLNFVSISRNVNPISAGTDYFVTKRRIDSQHDLFFKMSAEAVKLLLDNSFGKLDKKFEINSITDLEGKLINEFHIFLYDAIRGKLKRPIPAKKQKRKNFDVINLTLFLTDSETGNSGKFVISLPEVLLEPVSVEWSGEDKFNEYDFLNSLVDVRIKIGKIKSPVIELKNLDVEDIVVFDSTNVRTMTLVFEDWVKEFQIDPNPNLITPIDNNGNIGERKMSDNKEDLTNIWDKVLIEMGAEFEKVKLPLGELKKIENGQIVDVSSIYNNKLSLIVENKVIADGELVIVNDRYGVKITEIYAGAKNQGIQEAQANAQAQIETQEASSEDEEFDYGDFDLDDEDI